MKELRFQSGQEEFDLNGKIKVQFNPTDSFFVEKLYKAFEQLDKKQEQRQKEVAGMTDLQQVFAFSREVDGEMRAILDGVFDAPVSEAVFGEMNVYSMADGLPVWCNLLLAVMEVIDATLAREQKATNPRIQKYTAKYRR